MIFKIAITSIYFLNNFIKKHQKSCKYEDTGVYIIVIFLNKYGSLYFNKIKEALSEPHIKYEKG